MDEIKTDENHSEDNPPVLGSWKNIYSFVLIFLVVEVILFFYFTKVFE